MWRSRGTTPQPHHRRSRLSRRASDPGCSTRWSAAARQLRGARGDQEAAVGPARRVLPRQRGAARPRLPLDAGLPVRPVQPPVSLLHRAAGRARTGADRGLPGGRRVQPGAGLGARAAERGLLAPGRRRGATAAARPVLRHRVREVIPSTDREIGYLRERGEQALAMVRSPADAPELRPLVRMLGETGGSVRPDKPRPVQGVHASPTRRGGSRLGSARPCGLRGQAG